MDSLPPRPSWHLKIPPPFWGMIMLLAAYGADRLLASSVVFRFTLLSGWGERTFAWEKTEILPASPTNKKLVTRGPFRYTRNPMYLGMIMMASGFAFYFGTIPFYAVPVLLFLLCNFSFIPFEEAKMQRQFGDQYTDYVRRVRRWI